MGRDYNGNIPVTDQFLPDWQDTKHYLRILDFARDGAYRGEKIGWGAFAIKVNSPEMLSVLEECCGGIAAVDPVSLLERYAVFARELGTERYVALVSCEM